MNNKDIILYGILMVFVKCTYVFTICHYMLYSNFRGARYYAMYCSAIFLSAGCIACTITAAIFGIMIDNDIITVVIFADAFFIYVIDLMSTYAMFIVTIIYAYYRIRN